MMNEHDIASAYRLKYIAEFGDAFGFCGMHKDLEKLASDFSYIYQALGNADYGKVDELNEDLELYMIHTFENENSELGILVDTMKSPDFSYYPENEEDDRKYARFALDAIKLYDEIEKQPEERQEEIRAYVDNIAYDLLYEIVCDRTTDFANYSSEFNKTMRFVNGTYDQ